MKELLGLGIVGWWVIGFIGAGMEFAHAQREWPSIAERGRAQDRFLALACSLFGPINLAIALLICDWNHGWMNPFGRGRP